MVTTGWYWNEGVHSEVIDLVNPNVTCNDFPDFPIEMDNAFGGLFETMLPVQGNILAVICGGQSSSIDTQSKCYFYYPSRQEWTEVEEKLLQPRSTCGSVLINDRKVMWITGGFGESNLADTKTTTEFVSLDQPNVQGVIQDLFLLSNWIRNLNVYFRAKSSWGIF